MPGLLRGIARTAAVAGTASAVAGRVQHRQQGKWAAQDQQAAAEQAPPEPQYAPQEPQYAAPAAPSSPHTGAPAMPSAERVYTVQVLWDETMADGGAKWLAANPGGHLVILAGNGHCHDSAIVGRLQRRGIAGALSVTPVIDVEDNVASLLATPIHDYALVLQLPKE